MSQFLEGDRTCNGSSRVREGLRLFRDCQIVWRVWGVVVPVRWAWSSIFGRARVKGRFCEEDAIQLGDIASLLNQGIIYVIVSRTWLRPSWTIYFDNWSML